MMATPDLERLTEAELADVINAETAKLDDLVKMLTEIMRRWGVSADAVAAPAVIAACRAFTDAVNLQVDVGMLVDRLRGVKDEGTNGG